MGLPKVPRRLARLEKAGSVLPHRKGRLSAWASRAWWAEQRFRLEIIRFSGDAGDTCSRALGGSWDKKVRLVHPSQRLVVWPPKGAEALGGDSR